MCGAVFVKRLIRWCSVLSLILMCGLGWSRRHHVQNSPHDSVDDSRLSLAQTDRE